MPLVLLLMMMVVMIIIMVIVRSFTIQTRSPGAAASASPPISQRSSPPFPKPHRFKATRCHLKARLREPLYPSPSLRSPRRTWSGRRAANLVIHTAFSASSGRSKDLKSFAHELANSHGATVPQAVHARRTISLPIPPRPSPGRLLLKTSGTCRPLHRRLRMQETPTRHRGRRPIPRIQSRT